jgi:hypothetical protein
LDADSSALVRSVLASQPEPSVAPGTHLAADGKTTNISSDDPNTQAGMLEKYKQLAGVIPGISAFPGMDKAQFVPARRSKTD